MLKLLMTTAVSLLLVTGAMAQTNPAPGPAPDVSDDETAANILGEDRPAFFDGDTMRSSADMVRIYGELPQDRQDGIKAKCATVTHADNSGLKEFCGLISSK